MISILRRYSSTSPASMPSMAQLMAKLRAETGQSFALCRKALEKASMDLDVARSELAALVQAHAQNTQASGADREKKQGLVGLLQATDKSFGLIEMRCLSDFVARNPLFIELATKISSSLPESGSITSPEEHLESSGLKSVLLETVGKLKEPINVSRLERFRPSTDEIVGTYVHQQISPGFGTIAALVSVKVPPKSQQWAGKLAQNLAKHVAGMNPESIDELLSQEYIFDSEQSVQKYIETASEESGPVEITKMVRLSL